MEYQDVLGFKITFLVVRNEKGYCRLCSSVSYLLQGESGTSETRRLTTASIYTSLEMGPHHHGFCGRNASNSKTPRRNLVDRRLTFQVCSFLGHKNSLQRRAIGRSVYQRNCTITWDTSVSNIRPGYQICFQILARLPNYNGNRSPS